MVLVSLRLRGSMRRLWFLRKEESMRVLRLYPLNIHVLSLHPAHPLPSHKLLSSTTAAPRSAANAPCRPSPHPHPRLLPIQHSTSPPATAIQTQNVTPSSESHQKPESSPAKTKAKNAYQATPTPSTSAPSFPGRWNSHPPACKPKTENGDAWYVC